jgi:hypothetical protein
MYHTRNYTSQGHGVELVRVKRSGARVTMLSDPAATPQLRIAIRTVGYLSSEDTEEMTQAHTLLPIRRLPH